MNETKDTETKHDPAESKEKAKRRTRYRGDHAKFERSTCAQEMLIQALIARLYLEGISTPVFANARVAMRTKAVHGSKYCVRAADAMLIKPGLVIEVDGDAHDRIDKRCRRDNSREHDWGKLGFQVYRISNADVYDSHRLARLLDDIIALIRLAEARPDYLKQYGRRRQRILRARKAYQRLNPDYDFGVNGWAEGHRRLRRLASQPRPHARRGGTIYFVGRKPKGTDRDPNPNEPQQS